MDELREAIALQQERIVVTDELLEHYTEVHPLNLHQLFAKRATLLALNRKIEKALNRIPKRLPQEKRALTEV